MDYLLYPGNTYTETQLLSLLAEDDERAFRLLFNEYWDNIYGVALVMTRSREAAKDIVQEVFIKVWLQRRTLAQKESFRNFLFIITRNHIFSELRKKKKEQSVAEDLAISFSETNSEADEALMYKESVALIKDAVERLSPQQREVYLLSREQGLSQDQIAERLGISKATIKTHMSRALASIRSYLENHADSHLLLMAIMDALLWKK